MKYILSFSLILFCLACNCSKKATSAQTEDATTTEQNKLLAQLPACMQDKVRVFAAAEKENPPRKIIRYTYDSKTVYYIPPVCCDNYSDLYDENCSLLGHPDGGFTGRGDGRYPDFAGKASNEKIMWEDKR